jgi:hypothetical protein
MLQSLKYETYNRWVLELQGTEGAGLASVLKRLIGKR